MSYIDFESSGIEYRLILSRHGSAREEPIAGLDALVIETGMIDPEEFAEYLPDHPELENYFEEICEKDIPLYSVDNKGKSFLQNFASHVGHAAIIPYVGYGISKLMGIGDITLSHVFLEIALGRLAIEALPSYLGNNTSKFFVKMNSILSFIEQAPRVELRNALAARKIKKGVIPHVLDQYPERFSERKPKIGILYGAGHSSLKECIESDLRTRISLALHKYYGLKLVLEQDSLRDFYEFRLHQSGVVICDKLQIDSI